MTIRSLIILMTLGLFVTVHPVRAGDVTLIDLKGPIGPGISSFVTEAIDHANETGAAAIILRMDTPGGLDTSMRDIIRTILASEAPVISYVGPSGARAASAGTYILLASHVAVMAPGTNIGAATPVSLGGEAPAAADPKNADPDAPRHPTMKDKVINDAVAYIRSLAELRNRPADAAEKFVREAASLSADASLKAGLIDFKAGSIDRLLEQADGMEIIDGDRVITLDLADARLIEALPDWRDDFLALITNPNIAYLLLLAGIYGIVIEFSNPGLVAPGIIGAVALLLGLYALQMLPVNYAGLALIGLGIALMIAEVFSPSFGVMGVGGIVAFVLGSILLFDTDLPGFQVSPVVIGTTALVSSVLLMTIMLLAMRAWRRPVTSGAETMPGSSATVIAWRNGEGEVMTHGEVWNAEGPRDLKPADEVRIASRNGLVLTIEGTDTDIEEETDHD